MNMFSGEASSFSLALGWGGKGLVLFAVLAFLACAVLSIRNHEKLSSIAFKVGVFSLIGTFVLLLSLFLTHQFQYEYIFNHSARSLGTEYKIAGVWSGQEGSFLLWATCSGIFGLLALRSTGIYRKGYLIVYSIFLLSISAILVYESPFNLIPLIEGKHMVPQDGAGLTPTLINYWIVIHPPVIFLGFGSLTVLFAFAMSALAKKNLKDYVPLVRPWSLVSLAFLGVGLCMGGFWAYETLGWGGFWKWDPVENTSFVPWVLVAAFIHGVFIQQAKNKWHLGNVAFCGLPFIAFVYGTFLTRSGFLGDTSVHSFAEMDRTALWILVAIGGATLAAFLGFLITAPKRIDLPHVEAKKSGWLTKDGFYATGVYLLLSMGIITGIGMSVPLIQSMRGLKPKIVEEHLYHQVLVWPYPILAILIAVTPFLTWKAISFRELMGKLVNVLALTVGTFGFLLLWLKWGGSEKMLGSFIIGFPGQPVDPKKMVHFFGDVSVPAITWVTILTALTLFGVWANLYRILELWKKSNKTSLGGYITHAGVMLTMAGLIFSYGFEQKAELTINPAQAEDAFGYSISLVGRTGQYTDRDNKIELQVRKDGKEFSANPGLYFVAGQGGEPSPIQIPYIHSNLLYDLYFVIHPFTFVGSDPTELEKGQIGQFKTLQVRFNGYHREGEAGMAGAKFIADLDFVDIKRGLEGKAAPSIQLTGDGPPEQEEVPLGDTPYTAKLSRIDAASGSATLEINYKSEAFPLEIYYKPLTGLVWWGVGIMGFGGLLAAYSRRTTTSSQAKTDSTSDTE